MKDHAFIADRLFGGRIRAKAMKTLAVQKDAAIEDFGESPFAVRYALDVLTRGGIVREKSGRFSLDPDFVGHGALRDFALVLHGKPAGEGSPAGTKPLASPVLFGRPQPTRMLLAMPTQGSIPAKDLARLANVARTQVYRIAARLSVIGLVQIDDGLRLNPTFPAFEQFTALIERCR